MDPYKRHLFRSGQPIKKALEQLNELAADAILFVVDNDSKLLGSLTDGDVRRGLLKGLDITGVVDDFVNAATHSIIKGQYSIEEIVEFRSKNFKVVPVLDTNRTVVNVINFRFLKSYLPINVVIMAGGRGERLRPATDHTPKPLLRINDKPIIDYNIERLINFGIERLWVTIKYLGEQIQNHLRESAFQNISISYVQETEPLGTIGAVSKIQNFDCAYVLVTNSDILTNLDYEDFFLTFLQSGADFSVVTIPYDVSVPYAVLETSNGHVVSFKEKPTYTYYSNGGIYLMKKEVTQFIPQESFYNATDLMELLIQKGLKVHSYPLRGYWLDIGRPEDFKKAQEDIKHIKF